jgi:hypothetical protein
MNKYSFAILACLVVAGWVLLGGAPGSQSNRPASSNSLSIEIHRLVDDTRAVFAPFKNPDPGLSHLISDWIVPTLLLGIAAVLLALIITIAVWKKLSEWGQTLAEMYAGRIAKRGRLEPDDRLDLLTRKHGIWDSLYFGIQINTDQHLRLLRKYTDYYSSLGFRNGAQMAAAELFTEKAQTHLTKRSNDYDHWAVFAAFCAALMLCAGILVVVTQDSGQFVKKIVEASGDAGGTASWAAIVIYFIRSAAIAGFFGGGLYFFASISRAYFHEATVLRNRRHATRLGRLYLMLKYGDRVVNEDQEAQPQISAASPNPRQKAVDQLDAAMTRARANIYQKIIDAPELEAADIAGLPNWVFGPMDINAKELEEAFGWNLAQTTAFKDIKPENMNASLYVKMLEALGRVAERTAPDKSKGD